MRHVKQTICILGLCAMLTPMGGTLQADNKVFQNFAAYPTPIIKPIECGSLQLEETNHENIDKKRAAAAALGLYLGIKTATSAPKAKADRTKSICT